MKILHATKIVITIWFSLDITAKSETSDPVFLLINHYKSVAGAVKQLLSNSCHTKIWINWLLSNLYILYTLN